MWCPRCLDERLGKRPSEPISEPAPKSSVCLPPPPSLPPDMRPHVTVIGPYALQDIVCWFLCGLAIGGLLVRQWYR